MQRYIGLDVHAQTTALAVVSANGKKLSAEVLETNASTLIERVKLIPRPRALCLEEGNQSAWLAEVLSPHVDRLVVMVPAKHDRTTTAPKNDIADAYARAEDLRRNAVDTPVYKAPAALTELRAAFALHCSLNQDTVRAKNRVKAIFSSRGISTASYGHDLYDPPVELLEELLRKLPQGLRFSAEARLEQIFLLEEMRERAAQVLIGEAKKQEGYGYLTTVPAIGAIRSATILAVGVDPHRFRTSHQFWSYSGLGIRTVVSGEWRYSDGKPERRRTPLTRGLKQGNPHLKNVFKGAARTLSAMTDEHPLALHYRALLSRGLKEPLARLTIARKLAAIALAVWKNQEVYDPKKHTTMT